MHKIGWDIYWPNISQCCWKMQVPREALYGQLLLWVGDMEKWVVEVLNRGYIMKRFLPKNQHIQRKLLNFEFWINGEQSQSAKI